MSLSIQVKKSGNNYGLIWLEENLLGNILKCHVSIDRKMADIMSVSTEKTVYKNTCKPAIFSDIRIILNLETLLEK